MAASQASVSTTCSCPLTQAHPAAPLGQGYSPLGGNLAASAQKEKQATVGSPFPTLPLSRKAARHIKKEKREQLQRALKTEKPEGDDRGLTLKVKRPKY